MRDFFLYKGAVAIDFVVVVKKFNIIFSSFILFIFILFFFQGEDVMLNAEIVFPLLGKSFVIMYRD